ncbi:MAG: hypothetical protein Q8T13_17010 [Acidobacteriota bacterium]|nr:hypothetical protein [Acidobacteriota bacterium]
MKAVILTLCVLASACGGGSSSPTAPSATPQPYNQTVTGTVSSLGIVQHPLSIPRSGNMTLTLSWGTTADLDLYLTNSSCNAYPPDSCQILAASDGVAATERITRTVTSGESFKIWVDSFSFSPQNYTIAISIQ